jgi:Na+/H+ antiporter NhaD/arsenite permease-like protein
MTLLEILAIVVFCLGYLAIALEHTLKLNKAAPALLIAVFCWTLYVAGFLDDEKKLHSVIHGDLLHHLAETAQILFFLLAAMTIVEVIDAHQGFEIITKRIQTQRKRTLLWIICLVTFFLSAVLDNLTTSIVMVSVLRKLVSKRNDRIFYLSMVVIAANAGGAWSPIGDVTTTMLWIGGQITASKIIITLILPSLVCVIVPLFVAGLQLKGKLDPVDLGKMAEKSGYHKVDVHDKERNLIFALGVGGLLFVPVFKTLTHLPPFMGILLSLGLVWTVTEVLHQRKEDNKAADNLSVMAVLQRVDVPSVLFFLGILLAVGALQSMGILGDLAQWLDTTVDNYHIVGLVLGLLSALVDNVPLVAASMGMYPISEIAGSPYAIDGAFWHFIAYCAGTGGSTLIIGSVAGVAVMGMEHIDFIWYLKRIAWLSIIGYMAGAACYMAIEFLFLV